MQTPAVKPQFRLKTEKTAPDEQIPRLSYDPRAPAPRGDDPTRLALDSYREKWAGSFKAPEAKYAEAFDKWSEIVAMQCKQDLLAGGERADSWTNLLTGIGTSRDKVTASTFSLDGQLPFQTLEALYHNEDMAARVCDLVPEQMMREGFEVGVDKEPDLAEEVENYLAELDASEQVESAMIWARLYGGGVVLVGADDGQDASKELKEDRIQSIDFLTALDRYVLFPLTWYDDPTKPKFGMPQVYQILQPATSNPMGAAIIQVGQQVHETRLIRFPGARTSLRKKRANFGWDDSVLQRVYQVLMSFGLNWASVTHLLSDASQGVFKVKDLLGMIAGNNKEALLARMMSVDESRSSARMMMVDSENESFERTPTPFGGIPELLDRTAQRLAAAAQMPVTVLMGTSPGGMNATGESDIRNWYDKIGSLQKRVLEPRLKRLVKLCMLAKNGPTGGNVPDKFSVEFPPLWQMTKLEEAQQRLAIAQTDAIYLTAGVITAEEVGESRYRPTGYNTETTIDLDLRQELKDTDAQAGQLGAGKAAVDAEAAAVNNAATAAKIDPNAAKPAKPVDVKKG